MTNKDGISVEGLVKRLRGPVQWGYMCLADGGFIKDDTPFAAADLIESQQRVSLPPSSPEGIAMSNQNYRLSVPEYSPWRVTLIEGTHYHPKKGREPNAFHRFMQRLCFGVRWEKMP